MKVQVIKSFDTAKGIISEGSIIDIPENLFNRLKGKVIPFPCHNSFKVKPAKPITKGRRETLRMVADAILEQAVQDIQAVGVWQLTPTSSVLEKEINRIHGLLLEGLATLEEFKNLVTDWKRSGVTLH